MSIIRAVLSDPAIPGRLALQEVAFPQFAPSEALVRVGAISLNRGEVRRALTAEAGWRPGWDLAGVVERAAEDGSGPKQGSRVVGLLPSGARAEVDGMCVNFGTSATATVTFDLRSFFIAGGTSFHGFYLFQELQHESAQSGLTCLGRLVEAQHLHPQIALEESWEHISEVAQQLMERRFAGKAVLTVTPGLK